MATADGGEEPAGRRDLGPYQSADQARAQLTAIIQAIPAAERDLSVAGEVVLVEALLLVGVTMSGWEDAVRQRIVHSLPPEAAQVVAGWLLRAHLAGADESWPCRAGCVLAP
ncbi:hypothetical protein ACQP2F_16235 [Actinoplanes sp. CA-030573]|uniref:hypothetical protein n=1 Tax=Actinoplanes sp. CA-030573 TaxID=3239898 RepID=UPI003D8D9851